MNIKGRSVSSTGKGVCLVSHKSKAADFEAWYLLTSDHHWDNPKCNRTLLKRHLDEAVARDAGVIVAGDLFCAMQGKYDRRSDKSDVRPEHQSGEYLDRLVDTAAEWYGPYSHNLLVVSEGNHESALRNRLETSLTDRLVKQINSQFDSNVCAGGYGGWVRFSFDVANHRHSINLKYYHGSGGGGAVTKGVIKTNRMATYLPDAHIVMTGHVHESWLVELCRERVKSSGSIYQDSQTHICCGTYKEDYGDGTKGWHVETGKSPRPLGGWWLRFFWDGRDRRVKYELSQAK